MASAEDLPQFAVIAAIVPSDKKERRGTERRGENPILESRFKGLLRRRRCLRVFTLHGGEGVEFRWFEKRHLHSTKFPKHAYRAGLK